MNYNDILFKHIQKLAWNILIDSHSAELPVKITPIAKAYQLSNYMDYSKTRWENALNICKLILEIFGLNYNIETPELLAIRIMCPLCVLKDCNVTQPETVVSLCEVPREVAIKRLNRLEKMKERNVFYTSNLEKRVRDNFNEFIIKNLYS